MGLKATFDHKISQLISFDEPLVMSGVPIKSCAFSKARCLFKGQSEMHLHIAYRHRQRGLTFNEDLFKMGGCSEPIYQSELGNCFAYMQSNRDTGK